MKKNQKIRNGIFICLCATLLPVLVFAQAAWGKAGRWAAQHLSDAAPVVERVGKEAGNVGGDMAQYAGRAGYLATKELSDEDDNSFGTIVLIIAGVAVVIVVVKKIKS